MGSRAWPRACWPLGPARDRTVNGLPRGQREVRAWIANPRPTRSQLRLPPPASRGCPRLRVAVVMILNLSIGSTDGARQTGRQAELPQVRLGRLVARAGCKAPGCGPTHTSLPQLSNVNSSPHLARLARLVPVSKFQKNANVPVITSAFAKPDASAQPDNFDCERSERSDF